MFACPSFIFVKMSNIIFFKFGMKYPSAPVKIKLIFCAAINVIDFYNKTYDLRRVTNHNRLEEFILLSVCSLTSTAQIWK